MYTVETKSLGSFDVAVCGGGIAGVCAAVSAARNGARVILVESAGSLGGTVTEGLMGNLLDVDNKKGIIQELQNFLNERNMTCVKSGPRTDENGNYFPGPLIDVEGTKYFFDKICFEAGVKGISCFGMGLTLREGNREYFYKALDKYFPGLKEKYIKK